MYFFFNIKSSLELESQSNYHGKPCIYMTVEVWELIASNQMQVSRLKAHAKIYQITELPSVQSHQITLPSPNNSPLHCALLTTMQQIMQKSNMHVPLKVQEYANEVTETVI